LKKHWKILKIFGVNSTKENAKISGKIAKNLTPKNSKIKKHWFIRLVYLTVVPDLEMQYFSLSVKISPKSSF
jgi:hypothetical protein